MEKSNKRGKIPQSDWPLIMARYEAGETLASIARTYDCSPPAISYVVSKSRARQPARERPRSEPERAGIAADQGNPGRAAESRLRARRSRHRCAEPHDGSAQRRSRQDSDAAAAPARSRPAMGATHRMTRGTDGLLRDGFAERGRAAVRLHRARPAEPETGGLRRSVHGTPPAAPSPQSRGEPDTRHRLHLLARQRRRVAYRFGRA